MTPQTRSALFDELSKIAGAGSAIVRVAPKAGGAGAWAKKYVKGIGKNMSGAIKDLSQPIKSSKRELKSIGRDVTNARASKGFLEKAKRLSGHTLNAVTTGVMGRDAIRKEDSSGQGQSRIKRVSRLVGSTIGGLATGSRGLSGGILGSTLGERAGSMVGTTIDKIRGYKSKRIE